MTTPWNHNITWLANSKRARSGATGSRSQSRRKEESTDRHDEVVEEDQEPSFSLKDAITTMNAYTLNKVCMGDVVNALEYATTHPSYLLDLSQCIAKNSTRLFRSLHTALTSNYLQAVRIYTSIVERVLELSPEDSSSSSFSSTPALLSALLHESENVKLLMWVVEDAATRLLGTEHITDAILSRSEAERVNEVRLATPQSAIIDAIHHLLSGVIIPLVSSCGTGPTSSHGILETKLKGELVRGGVLDVLFNTIDYCNLWLAGNARFVKDGIKTVDDILNGSSTVASPLTEDTKLIETFRLVGTNNTNSPENTAIAIATTPSTIVGSLLRLGRTSATALIHLLKTSKETKKIFVGASAEGPSYALRAIAGVYHASDSYLQLQLCEGLVRGYTFDRSTLLHTTIPQDKTFLETRGMGASNNHLISYIDVLIMGISSLPSDASLIPQCRRLLRNLEDRQRGGEGSPQRRAAGSGGSNNLAEVPPLTATFDVLRVEFGVDNNDSTGATTTTTTASQRGGELFLTGDNAGEEPSSTTHANAETTTVVFSPMFFLLRPPTAATSDAPAPNPFTIPHDRITSVKLTRDKRFGFKLTPSVFEGRVLAEDRKKATGAVDRHPSALLHDSTIVTSLINVVENKEGTGGEGEADSSDLLRLFLYMQRCDMKVRPSLYRQQDTAPSSFMLYLCTTSATIAAITSSNLQVWIKRTKAAYVSATITAPDPPAPPPVVADVVVPTNSSSSAAIGRNQALSFVGGDDGYEDFHDRRSSRLIPPSASSSVAPLNGDRRSMGSTTSSNNMVGRGSVQSHDPDMFGETTRHHQHTPIGSSLPLRGMVASVSDAIAVANEASKYKSRLAVVERYREMIEARTAQYKLNHRLRRQEFEEVIVKPVFENVLNGSIPDGITRITTTARNGSTTQPESTLSGFDADIKSTVVSLNNQLEGIEAVGDSIVDVIRKLKEEYGDGVDVVERRKKSLQGTNNNDDDEEDNNDVPIDREMLSPIQRKQRNSTVLRDIVKSLEKQALEAIKERVERKLVGLEAQMKEVVKRRCALEDPSPVIRSFAARQRAQDEEDHIQTDRRRRTSKV